MRLLLIEDEPSLREGLEDLLAQAGWDLEVCADLSSADKALDAGFLPGVAVVDRMLPDGDGLDLVRRLRAQQPRCGILVLTARVGVEPTVEGLAAGADDYLSKPFSSAELLARLDALARRVDRGHGAERFELDSCLIDLGSCKAQRDGRSIRLTAKESSILRHLVAHRERAVSRAELLTEVWGANADLETRTIDMTIAKLRRKIERDTREPKIVCTVIGVGYQLGDS